MYKFFDLFISVFLGVKTATFDMVQILEPYGIHEIFILQEKKKILESTMYKAIRLP